MERPVKSDARYTVSREHCGQDGMRYVARFCGEWLGQSISRNSMIMRCVGDSARRRGCAVVDEQK